MSLNTKKKPLVLYVFFDENELLQKSAVAQRVDDRLFEALQRLLNLQALRHVFDFPFLLIDRRGDALDHFDALTQRRVVRVAELGVFPQIAQQQSVPRDALQRQWAVGAP